VIHRVVIALRIFRALSLQPLTSHESPTLRVAYL
jgi:hypothetical protein